MRIKTSDDAHQNGRGSASGRETITMVCKKYRVGFAKVSRWFLQTIVMVSRPDAEPRPFPSAFLPVLVGFSANFAGYLRLFLSGCFDRMNWINEKPCEMGFPPRISPIHTALGSG